MPKWKTDTHAVCYVCTDMQTWFRENTHPLPHLEHRHKHSLERHLKLCICGMCEPLLDHVSMWTREREFTLTKSSLPQHPRVPRSVDKLITDVSTLTGQINVIQIDQSTMLALGSTAKTFRLAQRQKIPFAISQLTNENSYAWLTSTMLVVCKIPCPWQNPLRASILECVS